MIEKNKILKIFNNMDMENKYSGDKGEEHRAEFKEILHNGKIIGNQFCEVYSLGTFLDDQKMSLSRNKPDFKSIIEKGNKRTGKPFVKYKKLYRDILEKLYKGEVSAVKEKSNEEGCQIIELLNYLAKNGFYFSFLANISNDTNSNYNNKIINLPTCAELDNIRLSILAKTENNFINTDEIYDCFENDNDGIELSQEIRDKLDEQCNF